MSENMVERVARAIFDSLKGVVHCGGWDFGSGDVNVSEEAKDRYRRMARAAIEAMREPTEAMVGEAVRAVELDALGSLDNDVGTTWQAMIDAALK